MENIKKFIGIFLPVYYMKITDIETGEENYKWVGSTIGFFGIPIGSVVLLVLFINDIILLNLI